MVIYTYIISPHVVTRNGDCWSEKFKNRWSRDPVILLFVAGAGNEVIQYMPAEDFSSLYDVSDLLSSYQAMFDPAAGDSALLTAPDNDDILQTLYDEASQNGATIPNSRQTAAQNAMEDID